MHAEVRELLEQYELNNTHLVVKSGTVADGKLVCDPNGIHVGDNTQYGKITDIDFDVITCEDPIEASPLKVQVYDYVTDAFIDKTFEKQVKPIVLRYAPLEVTECEEQVRSQAGRIYFSHRGIVDILEIEGNIIRIDKEMGYADGDFREYVKVKYTYGGEFADVHRACVLLTASFVLGFIGSSTGGGSLNVQGYGRNYGARGKYHDVRQEFDRNAYQLLQKYVVGIV
jgi:hypothetical protein